MSTNSSAATFAALHRLLAERVLTLDGAMGTMIQRHKLNEADFRGERFAAHPRDQRGNSDVLVLTRPDIVSAIHHEYLAAGADIIETNTFSSTAIAQSDYALEPYVYEMNLEGARLARAAAVEWTKKTPRQPRFVAGSMGPTNRTVSIPQDVNDRPFRGMTFDQAREAYEEQVRGLLDGGVDVLLLETIFDALNAQAGIAAIENVFEERGMRVPVMLSMTTTDNSDRLLSGQTLDAFYLSIRHAKPFSVGINCALGAREMRPCLAELAAMAECYVSVHPNAGLPDALGQYDELPGEFAALLQDFAASGLANIVGGCCGTTPDHIVAVRSAVDGLQPRRLPSGSWLGINFQLPTSNLQIASEEVVAAGSSDPAGPDAARAEKLLISYEEACANGQRFDWDDHVIASPWFLGRRYLDDVPLEALAKCIDWTIFLSASEMKARYPGILSHPEHGSADELFEHAQTLLRRVIDEKLLTARGVYGFWPANTEGDDVVVYKDDSRRAELARLPMLRQQEVFGDQKPNRSLADFIAPRESGVPDYLGLFAVTAGIGADELVRRFESDRDDYHASIVKAIADRLADAFAEYLHAQARKDWGYGEGEKLNNEDLIAGKYRGIRPSYGYPACPDHSERFKLFELLDAGRQGITLTESGAMLPAASVSGLYFSHPEAKYFNVGPIDRDQLECYAKRKGMAVGEIERLLAANLAYDPAALTTRG